MQLLQKMQQPLRCSISHLNYIAVFVLYKLGKIQQICIRIQALLVQDDANSPKIVLLNINSEDRKTEICYWFTTDYEQRIKRERITAPTIFFYCGSLFSVSKSQSYRPPLVLLQFRQSIWQFSMVVLPPSHQGMIWSPSINS